MRTGTIGALALIGITAGWSGLVADADSQAPGTQASPAAPTTATPIQHLVIIYQENVSFDHYFGTYPSAANVPGEPSFTAQPGTPTPNNYLSNPSLLTNNPNLNSANGNGATNPFRLDRTQAATADQDHNYTPEQQAFDNFNMDLFPKFTGAGTPGGVGAFGTTGQVMGYYDGNTVTALWNYAQHFAMSDTAFDAQFGPSTPGALNVVSGQTNGMNIVHNTSTSFYIPDGQGGYSEINDADPAFDTCSIAANGNEVNFPSNTSIGDLLNAANITWGGFAGGFNLSITNANGTTGCARSTLSAVTGVNETDYIQHHDWFQYFPTTINPNHTRPTSLATIGTNDPANHEYDLLDFYNAVSAGDFPAVSYIKMPAYQDGHAGYSDPLDEQTGIVTLINFLQRQPGWSSTAVIITYDDSDGWYDHVSATTTSSSFNATADQLNGPGTCGTGSQQNGVGGKPVNGRCGPGPRLPFIVISPWAKPNYISHVQISQASVIRFIEDNWLNGQRLGEGSFDASAGSIMDLFNFSSNGTNPRRFLNPTTGVTSSTTLTHDFADNGYSGIAWLDNHGDSALWLMNGASVVQSAGVGTAPTNWSIVGQRDFNGDGTADFLWHDTSGDVAIWEMNGATILQSLGVGTANPSVWSIVGTGDFFGNGNGDILWRDTSGDVAIWELSGSTIVQSCGVGTAPTSWSIVGTGDFNGDGMTDILWHDTSGDVAIWEMNGCSVLQSAGVGNANPSVWSIAGTGDFSGVGRSDILWHDTSGDVAIWFMNGATITQSLGVGTANPSAWSIAQTGDYYGAGTSDILWRDTSGDVAVWQLNGATVTQAAYVGTAPNSWSIQGAGAD